MKSRTILIVDDAKAHVDALLALLEDQYIILVALDGQSALKFLNEAKVDLLLLDVAMPLMHSFELCQKIKKNSAIKDIPIVFMAESRDDEGIERAYDAGGVDVVTKPFRKKELLARIETHLKIQTLQSSLLKEKSSSLSSLRALSENQQKLQAIFDNTPDALLIINRDGDIEACNASLLAMSEFVKEDLINAHFDLLLPDCNNMLTEYCLNQVINIQNTSMVTSSGREFSVEISLFHYLQSESDYYIIILRDNTERQAKEALLRSSEEKLRTIIENANNIICTMDQHRHFTFLSPTWSEYLGYSVTEGLDKPIDQFIYSEDLGLFKRTFMEHESGDIPHFECRLMHASGVQRWFSISGRLVKDSNDGSQFYVVVLENITEHKGVMQALMESEERFRLLFESMSHGVVVTDKEGAPVIVNQAVEKILGMDYSTLIDKFNNKEIELINEQHEVIKPNEFPPFVTMKTGGSLNNRVLGIRNHNEHQDRWISMNVVAQAGNKMAAPERVFITFSDMTERRLAEYAVQDYLRYLNVMERMNEVGIRALSVDELLRNILKELIFSFKCRSAWIVYPYDPEQQLSPLTVLVGKNSSDEAVEMQFSIDAETQKMLDDSLGSDNAKTFLASQEGGLPKLLVEQYRLKAVLTAAVFPKKSKPWLLCICYGSEQEALHAQQDCLILENIAKRLADYLTSFDSLNSLRESEESLKEAQKIGQIGNWSHDLKSDEVYWSEQVYRILGKDSLWFTPQHDDFLDVVHPDDREQVNKYDQIIRRQGGKQGYDFRVSREEGAVRWVHAEVISDTLRGIVPNKIRGTFQDITQIKKSEDQLKQAENQVRMILESAAEGIFGLDKGGNATFVNTSASEMLGYLSNEIVGKPVHSLIHHSYRDGSSYPIENCPFNQALNKGIIQSNQNDILWRKNGSYFPVEYSVMPIKSGSQILGAVVTFRDISGQIQSESEKKVLQDQLQQAQKMEAIGQLTGGIAHDFNNMLASMLGYSELALRITAQSENEKLTRYIEEIFKAGERGRDLIAKMLAFSRGVDDSKPEAILLEPLLTDVLKMLRSVMPASITITIDVEGEVPAVMVDTINLQQIIMNLCINARDAMEGKGSLNIIIRNHRCHEKYCSSCHENFSGDYVELEIADNGSGIEEDNLIRMFEPFFTTKEMGKGTGMGLSVVHGVVHSSGGHLGVSSVLGKGTTISIYFPPTDLQAEEGGDVINSMDEEKHAGQILIVDDEPSVGKFLQEILQIYGYECDYQPSSTEALKQIKENPSFYQLVISDVTMPEMTGIELAEELKLQHPNLPVILCTGYSDILTPEVIEEMGVLDVLKKPLNSMELLASVERAIAAK